MRGSIVGGFLLLQVPVSVYSLPIPVHAQDQIDSVTAQHTFSHPTQTPTEVPVLFVTADEEDGPTDGESTSLEQELAELQALRAQLVELGREVSAREQWLANAVGVSTTPSTSLTDCASVTCLVQNALRKAKYAASAVLGLEETDPVDDGNETTGGNKTIPLPPWRQTPPYGGNNSSRNGTTSPADDVVPFAGTFYPALPLLLVVLLVCLSGLLGRRCDGGEDDYPGTVPMLPLHATSAAGNGVRAVPGEERGRWWKGLWGRILMRDGCGRDSNDRFEPGTGRREEEWGQDRFEAGDGCSRDGEDELRDEKGFVIEGDRTLLVNNGSDAEEQEEEEEEEEARSEGGSDSEQEEELTLGEELASFRAALDLVEGLVAAGERREMARES